MSHDLWEIYLFEIFFEQEKVDLTDSQRCGASIIGLSYFTYLFFFSGLEFTLTFLTHNRYGFSRMDQVSNWYTILMNRMFNLMVRNPKPSFFEACIFSSYIFSNCRDFFFNNARVRYGGVPTEFWLENIPEKHEGGIYKLVWR